jgi:hypothetical protein
MCKYPILTDLARQTNAFGVFKSVAPWWPVLLGVWSRFCRACVVRHSSIQATVFGKWRIQPSSCGQCKGRRRASYSSRKAGNDNPDRRKDGWNFQSCCNIIAFDPDWSQLSKAQQVAEHKDGILFVAGPGHTHQVAEVAGLAFNPLQKLVPVVLKDGRLVKFDSSRPYPLQVAPKTTIKLVPGDEAPIAAWNRYFWDNDKFKLDPDQQQEPKRGFHTCYPVAKLRRCSRLSPQGAADQRRQDRPALRQRQVHVPRNDANNQRRPPSPPPISGGLGSPQVLNNHPPWPPQQQQPHPDAPNGRSRRPRP